MEEKLPLVVSTPLWFSVVITEERWLLISATNHPVIAGRLDSVIATLSRPVQVRRSRHDPDVYLFYGEQPRGRWICAAAKDFGTGGLLITAYLTDAIKVGAQVWSS